MVQMATAATTHEAATMREMTTDLGRKEAPSSLDLSASSGVEDGLEVVVTRTVERLVLGVEPTRFAVGSKVVVGAVGVLEETEACWVVEEDVATLVVVVGQVPNINELD
jgi:hypothetical protein